MDGEGANFRPGPTIFKPACVRRTSVMVTTRTRYCGDGYSMGPYTGSAPIGLIVKTPTGVFLNTLQCIQDCWGWREPHPSLFGATQILFCNKGILPSWTWPEFPLPLVLYSMLGSGCRMGSREQESAINSSYCSPNQCISALQG